ncbi:MAG: NAD+ synthase [Sphingomicrobium sp.]
MTGKAAGKLRIALAQIDQRVGDIDGNARRLLEWRDKATGADIVMFPELQLTGYPPEDLVLRPEFVRRSMEASERLIDATADGGPAILFGSLHAEDGKVYNAYLFAEGAKLLARRLKRELPNYGTFDEKRVFASGPLPEPVEYRGVRFGIPICEDIWRESVCAHLKEQGAQFLLVPNGSPFELNKDEARIALVERRVTETGLPIAYLNRVGGQDELVFEGASFVINGDGQLACHLPDFEEALVTIEWEGGPQGWRCLPGRKSRIATFPEDVYRAMMMGLRDYVAGNGFAGIILGLSGGIDSALSAAVAVDALGSDKVRCVMMPSKYTSRESLEDAENCAKLLGCRHDVISIERGVEAFDTMLDEPKGLAAENIQARLRMVTLMALSNTTGDMLLTTGNKSEMSVGFATLYGDMAGGYSVLKDAYKTTVFTLSRWRNEHRPAGALGPDGAVMPQRVIDKPPSAELRPNQKDEDSLPPYPVLDRILDALVEHEMSVAEAAAKTGEDEALIAEIERKLLRAEYKRRQSPPGVKIGKRNFGRDRRYPITNAFHTGPVAKKP